MSARRKDRCATGRLAAGALLASMLLGCSTTGPAESPFLTALAAPPKAAPSGGYDFFNRPGLRDPWSMRIARWQLRQRAAYRAGLIRPLPKLPAVAAGAAAAPAVAADAADTADTAGGSLATRYEAFLGSHRRAIARQVLAWVQTEAEQGFVDDGPVDHWPTLPEVLVADGDDCDGLELLTYHALRRLGFGEKRVYRAILRGARFGEHHMVTLWFEDTKDPWVLDPTTTATTSMVRLSELDRWVPLAVFSETRQYTVTAR